MKPGVAERVRSGLEAVLGRRVGPGERGSGDGGPSDVPRVEPRSVEEAAAVLSAATGEGWRVAFRGAGQRWGTPAFRGRGPDLWMSTRGLAGVRDHVPEDLTVSVGGGATLAELDAHVAPHGQLLPADPPGDDGATLGGVLAAGADGPWAPAAGGVRDLVLGLTCVTGDGRVLTLGGRVVKNVAGWDLVRLLVGSQGRLGLVAAATVRLVPRPARTAFLIVRAREPGALVEAARAVATAPFLPAGTALSWASGEAAALRVRLAGTSEGVEARAAELVALAPGLEGEASERGAEGATRSRAMERGAAVVLRLRTAPADLGRAVDQVTRLGATVGGIRAVADPLTGVVRVAGGAGEDRAAWVHAVEATREAVGVRGEVVVVRGPAPVLQALDDGLPRDVAVAGLVDGLRRHFDPAGILVGPGDEDGR